ncbi:DNA cytosine methyltransferase [Microbacterium galbinum]|uniref:DNA (cytosine-5-)-methyltransferase n=1 Tax=Microbacterium galbinum TaxID=2851646 RepID=A0ABY4IM62_9MICO|nr:DNA cytosine methyltransferase [Microbacterium galbinum]UPL13041.1 DNA cytosine methyltransferase [Microbacterium galbinum]
MTGQIVALDHFAGTGWGVALRSLGIREHGVELMDEAVATREAAGFDTVYRDVWDGLADRRIVPEHDLFIASPPCQTFSVAGRGTGRLALDQVRELIEHAVWKDAAALRAAGSSLGDDRTSLVLTPLAHIWVHRPRLIALEQVPTVLPVWEAMSRVLRELGYSVWVGNLQAEQYGVPQTRKRAILMASLSGDVAPPTPTHSRYHSHDPQRLDTDVQKWVSMADALGWEGFAAEKAMGRGMVARHGDRPGRAAEDPAFTIRASAGGMEPGGFRFRRRGLTDRPSPTITGGGTDTGGAEPIAKLARYTSLPSWEGDTRRLVPEEAAALQSYPIGFPFQGGKGKQFLQIGNAVPPLLAAAIISRLTAPQLEEVHDEHHQ